MEESADWLQVEVAYAAGPGGDQQALVPIRVPRGASVEEAVRRSGILERFPEVQLDRAAVGVHGRRVALSEMVRDGDRVEIYRPLTTDPKLARRRRAERKGG
jgi:uncharacterized protein